MQRGVFMNTMNPGQQTIEETENNGDIGYPVHIYFVELSKMYMKRISWQWHPEIEVLIINHGEANFYSEDCNVTLKAGQGILINQNVMHAIHSVDSKGNCSMYSFVFHPSFLFGYGNTLLIDKYLTPVLSSPSLRTMVLDESDPLQEKLLNKINSIIAVNMIKKFGYEVATKSYLCDFWLMLLENIVVNDKNQKGHRLLNPDEARAKEIIKYIEAHYAEKITLDDLSEQVHVSKSECCRCIKRTLHLTPIEYLMKYRIFVATNMIQSNNPAASSSSNLAFSVGFNNASYFNKVFRQYLNCTPNEYKKKLKQDPSFRPFDRL